MVFVGFWESTKAESIGDDKGIDFIGLLFIGVSPFEIPNEFWVELVDGGVKGSELFRGGQKVDQVEIEEGGGFGSDLEGRKSFFLDELEKLRFKGFCSGERIGKGGRSHLFSFLIHEEDGIGFRVHNTTDE
ncbi:MAG: hypothetical protein QXY90_05635 [Candidatus Anstonellales archaeon]